MAERGALALQLEAAAASGLRHSHIAAELEGVQAALVQSQLELQAAQQRAEAAEVGERVRTLSARVATPSAGHCVSSQHDRM